MQKRWFYLSVFFLFQLCMPALSEAGDHSPSAKFTDPNRGAVKPTKWREAPIKYDKWAKGADIAATFDQHLYPAFLPMVKTYAKKHNLDIAMREGTCGTSEGLLNKKQVDIGGFCCPPSLNDRLPGLEFHTMGIASLAILIHPENPVANLSAEQVRDIFKGKIRNWNQIELTKGKTPLNLPIRPIGRLHCKTRPGHWRSILDNEDMFSPSLVEVGTIHNMVAAVSEYKGAIGYEILWNLTKFKEHGTANVLMIDHVSPYDNAAVAQGKYPFYRVDNLTTWSPKGLSSTKASKLVEHLHGKAGEVQDVYALVPVEDLHENGWKFKEYELIGEP
jgi:phosphate transport system substrate-binding protein